MTVINIPFIAEINDSKKNSPIGIFTISWDTQYVTKSESIDPTEIDPNLLSKPWGRTKPNTQSLNDFYTKWNDKQFVNVISFDDDEKVELKNDIQQLLKQHPIHSVNEPLSLHKKIDMWIKAFPKEAHEYFEKLLDNVEEAIKDIDEESTDQAMYDLIDSIPGIKIRAEEEYGIFSSDSFEERFKKDVDKYGSDALDNYQKVDTALNWHCLAHDDPWSFDDSDLIVKVDKLTRVLKAFFQRRVKQAKEALKEVDD